MKYDYLIVGAGLFGAVFAHEATAAGKHCLVLEKRAHIGGTVYTEKRFGIDVHCYGAHVFHTNNREVWEYVNRFAEFNRFTNSPLARYRGKLYNLPFNMNTFYQLWGVTSPAEARQLIAEQIKREGLEGKEPANLEEKALGMVGRDLYEILVKGYTEKQWGTEAVKLPPFIIGRLPVRFTYDNNYFNDDYQGIPKDGYTAMIARLLEGTEVRLGVDFLQHREQYEPLADKIIYTGAPDAWFDYCLGRLKWRSLRFETQYLPETESFQGNAVVNYTEYEVPYTRIIEHKHFTGVRTPGTVITREYPAASQEGLEPYYPINDEENNRLAQAYRQLAAGQSHVIFGGRLGEYKYLDMDRVIAGALACAKREIEEETS